MKKEQQTEQNAQGSVDVPNKKVIETWMKKDLGNAIALLNAIYSDPDLLEVMAGFMQGRMINSEMKKQGIQKAED